MKKTWIILLAISSVINLFLIYKIYDLSTNQKPSTNNIIKPTETKLENKLLNTQSAEEPEKIVKRYIRIMKSNDTKVYSEKLQEMKQYLDENLYSRLNPKLTRKQINDMRKSIKGKKPFRVSNLEVSSSKTTTGYIVSVIYESQIDASSTVNMSRYLFRAKVRYTDKDTWLIYEIIEDSQLQDGRYDRQR